MDYTTRPNFYATPAWITPQGDAVQQRSPLSEINNVDIVFTNDKSKWSRCVVVETGNSDGDGRADPDGTGVGFAWFPGYAIDVETGVRVNIFFGENSAFGDNTAAPQLLSQSNGSDMMFNPSAQGAIPPITTFNAYNLVLGGMHYMYVTKQPYDECEFINSKLRENLSFRRIDAVREISWAGIALRAPGVEMLSYADGLIPTETVISLRADNPYATALGTNDNATYPSYEFEIAGKAAIPATTDEAVNAQLDMINVVPNPYLTYSAYEIRAAENVVKITNLPAKCDVTIYSLDGQFIRQYSRDEVELPNAGKNPGVSFSQVNPAIEWDMKNAAGIPISSGVSKNKL